MPVQPSTEWNTFHVSVLCPVCASEGPRVLIPVLFPCVSIWIAACSGFINSMVGAQCVVMLRYYRSVSSGYSFSIAWLTCRLLPKGSCAARLPGSNLVMGQPQKPVCSIATGCNPLCPGVWYGIVWCGMVMVMVMVWYESSAAGGVFQKSLKDMGEPMNVHQGTTCVVEPGRETTSLCTSKWSVGRGRELGSAFPTGDVESGAVSLGFVCKFGGSVSGETQG